MGRPHCSIYGCRSHMTQDKSIRYFTFPSRDSPMYDEWLSRCIESAELISSQIKPIVCSKHFYKKSIRGKNLAPGTVPVFFLTATPEFIEEERARLAEEAEKVRIKKLVEEVTFEWVKRAKTHAILAEICTLSVEMQEIAKRARNLLGAILHFSVEGGWIRKFRRSYLDHLTPDDYMGHENKSLDVKDIILELSPGEKFLRKEEIEVLLKEEKARMIERLRKYTVAKAKKRAAESEARMSAAEIISSESEVDSIEMSLNTEDRFEEDAGVAKHEVVIETYPQALGHLKSLREFALREEDQSVIEALNTVEALLRNPGEVAD